MKKYLLCLHLLSFSLTPYVSFCATEKDPTAITYKVVSINDHTINRRKAFLPFLIYLKDNPNKHVDEITQIIYSFFTPLFNEPTAISFPVFNEHALFLLVSPPMPHPITPIDIFYVRCMQLGDTVSLRHNKNNQSVTVVSKDLYGYPIQAIPFDDNIAEHNLSCSNNNRVKLEPKHLKYILTTSSVILPETKKAILSNTKK